MLWQKNLTEVGSSRHLGATNDEATVLREPFHYSSNELTWLHFSRVVVGESPTVRPKMVSVTIPKCAYFCPAAQSPSFQIPPVAVAFSASAPPALLVGFGWPDSTNVPRVPTASCDSEPPVTYFLWIQSVIAIHSSPGVVAKF